MTKEILGSGETIYGALESGQNTVPNGPLSGLPLYVPKENPNWTLPTTYNHITNTFADDDEIRAQIEAAYEETERLGALFVPTEIFEMYYERSKNAAPDDLDIVSKAAYETSYVIKGLSILLPYQQQRVIEQNNARAILGSYRYGDVPRYYRRILQDNFMPLGLPEMYDLFGKIDVKFEERHDTSVIGTKALIDEIDRLVAQIMNARWATIALPPGTGKEGVIPDLTGAAEEEGEVHSEAEILEAHEGFVASVGSERILAWGIGSTLENLGGYVIGKATFSGEQNPFNDVRNELIQRLKNASSSDEKQALRELLTELQSLGHLQSQYNKLK